MVTAVGFFDGVHLGHQAVLNGADRVLTLRNHPKEVLSSGDAPQLLVSTEERLELLSDGGRRKVDALDFTRELAATEPEEFAARHLPAGSFVRCGALWRFGRGGRGDAALLRRLGYSVEVVPAVEWGGEPVSSTRIRRALAEGDVLSAAAMLGRPFSADGRVFRGKGEGSRLGYPTVNVDFTRPLPLKTGVYAVSADGRSAIANYGVAPTFRGRSWPHPVLELHFADGFMPSRFGEECASLRIAFERFLRPEIAFDTADELRRQIAEDVAALGDGRDEPAKGVLVRVETVDDGLLSAELPKLLAELPAWRREKALSYRFDRDRYLCARAFRLLGDLLRERFGLGEVPEFAYGPNGKPFFKGLENVHFSMSHCPDAVGCAVSDRPVGFDVESVSKGDDIAPRVLSSAEIDAVAASPSRERAFTSLWTRKEAAVKLTGEGIDEGRLRDLLAEDRGIRFAERVHASGKCCAAVAWLENLREGGKDDGIVKA